LNDSLKITGMKDTEIKVLVIDDDEDDLFLTVDFLKAIDTFKIIIDTEINYKKAQQRIREDEFDIYIVDYLLGPHTGLELIQEAIKEGITKPFILLTGKGDRQIDIEATKIGAYDFLIKPEINTEMLERSLRYSTYRYRTYREVTENEKRFRDIFEKSTDSIFILDNNFRLIKFNPVLTQVLLYEPDEIMGKPITDLFSDGMNAEAFINKMKREEKISNHEVVLLTKKGDSVTFLASCIKISGTESGTYQVILFDYTTIKKSVADAILVERTEANSQLVRTLAHEIRNPLTNINLSNQQLEEDVSDDLKVFTGMIRRNSDRINALLTELITISNPTQLSLSPISISELLNDTLLAAEDRIKLKNIELVKELLSEHIVNADKEKMKIALLNIIINGIEAIDHEGGKMHITTHFVKDFACIKITDSGIGIQPENIDKLFQPYFTGKKNGMGLGLASTQAIVKAHNGNISVSSIPGKGTTFIISLPVT